MNAGERPTNKKRMTSIENDSYTNEPKLFQNLLSSFNRSVGKIIEERITEQCVDISRLELTDQNLDSLAEFVAEGFMDHVYSLNMSYNQITRNGVIKFFEAIINRYEKCNMCLFEIDISHNFLKNRGAITMVFVAKECEIGVLKMSHNEIENVGENFVGFLRENRCLKSLDLSDNEIKEAIEMLEMIESEFPEMEIDLRYNDIPEEDQNILFSLNFRRNKNRNIIAKTCGIYTVKVSDPYFHTEVGVKILDPLLNSNIDPLLTRSEILENSAEISSHIDFVNNLNPEYFVQYRNPEYFFNSQNFLVYDYAEYTLENFETSQTIFLNIIGNMLKAIELLHNTFGITHGKLTPGCVRIYDGTAKVSLPLHLDQILGFRNLSPIYCAPEILLGLSEKSFSGDVYSLAIIILEILLSKKLTRPNHERLLEELFTLGSISDEMYQCLKSIILASGTDYQRPTINEFSHIFMNMTNHNAQEKDKILCSRCDQYFFPEDKGGCLYHTGVRVSYQQVKFFDNRMTPVIIDESFWSCCGFDQDSRMKKVRPYYFQLKEGETIRKYGNFAKRKNGEFIQDHLEYVIKLHNLHIF